MQRDIHSCSEPGAVRVTHGEIDWDIDFTQRQIRGSVTWSFDRQDPSAPLRLDTRGLVITGVEVEGADGFRECPFDIGRVDPVLGPPLSVALGSDSRRVRVHYHTTDASAGIQWLTPEQTAGRRHPFLFSQAQSILARTFLPCQDTPGVRVTYEATVRTPPELLAVMSARSLTDGEGSEHRFTMPQPIPSYLIAIAVGELEQRPVGPRSAVYAEPAVIEQAAWEFAETEKYIETAEKLYGPYQWECYDILVLPPSFPFGGMENPRLTFATPTVIAGDRSLTSLVAHELAHSWSGNLVTNATWSDFWLNEGFTVYFERRIVEALHGQRRAEMEAVLGRRGLQDDLDQLPAGDTILNVDLQGRDPDDAFSLVPYEKGYLFLRLIETTVGRERFDRFLGTWFERNQFQSRTTADFEAWVQSELLTPEEAASVGIAAWLHEPGLPGNAPLASCDAFDQVRDLAARYAAGTVSAEDLPGDTWVTHEWLHFIESLPPDLPPEALDRLDARWSLGASGNSEILMKWLLQGIRSGYAAIDAPLERFLCSQGRRKFLKPLYAELAQRPGGRERAREIYRKARPLYHSISSRTLDELLEFSLPA